MPTPKLSITPSDRRTPPSLTPHQRTLIRAETGCSEKTINAWWLGTREVREATAMRLERGARKLGLVRAVGSTP
jgi:hypothetical protein